MFKKICLLFTIAILFTGCTNSVSETNSSVSESVNSVSESINSVSETVSINDNFDLPTTDFNDLQTAFSNFDLSADDWTVDEGAYVELNGNIPFFTDYTTDVFEDYSDLDEFGRCGIAFANICTELQPTEERGNIGMIKPSGWQTSKYDKELVSGMYLYNRCHLIGFQLAGENDNEKNLITGTRYLNIDGMLSFENMVDNYIDENPNNHVMYRVTPMYIDNDLVAQGVLMEAYSVEDNGKLQFCVWCYNVQPGIHIDYSNGSNYSYNNIPDDILEDTSSITESATDSVIYMYILNTNSKKIHKSTCSSVSNMKEENKEETSKSIEELESEGYTKCKSCNP